VRVKAFGEIPEDLATLELSVLACSCLLPHIDTAENSGISCGRESPLKPGPLPYCVEGKNFQTNGESSRGQMVHP
jgi:hypothetical protein